MKSATSSYKRGVWVYMIAFFLAALLVVRLGYVQLIKGDEYAAKAESQQLGDTTVPAKRGTIYDANMNVLAQSADVWKIYLNPYKLNKFEGEERQKVCDIIASGLSVILEIEEEKMREYLELDTSYKVIKTDVEKAMYEQVVDFINEYAKKGEESVDLSEIVCISSDVKRYYPLSTLASTVIGFTGTDGDGLEGLESYYNETLKGVAGRTLTAVKGNGSVMPNQFETVYEPQDGDSIVLTIDIYVQHILEEVLSEALDETGASGIYGIVMDVDTGAVLGMASLPVYDLNQPFTLYSQQMQDSYAEAASAPEEESEDEDTAYMRTKKYWTDFQRKNHAVTSTYEPGSVFKVITAAAAIEEGIADLNTTHYCTGTMNYASRDIDCWKAGGHGSETFVDLLKNSCNPFAVTLADKLGRDLFYDYFEAFGFTEKTGVDISGDFTPSGRESENDYGIYNERGYFSKSDLASYSFGQTFQVTPLQMITAISAVANGGKLMTPYLVSKVVDSDGNTVSTTEPTVRRQVISESTASIISDCMEQVVSTGTGKNAYVAGYHVAGKTGTSEKLTKAVDGVTEEYIASFCGFAPAYDPEISVIIIVDEPDGEHGGGAVAAPLAGEVFEQVLTYLGTEHSYTTEEMKLLLDETPDFVGKTVAESKNEVSGNDLSVKVIGEGDTVIAQYPEAGRELPADGMIVLYTEENYTPEKVTVPDFTGLTVSQANSLAASYGINIKISGSSLSSGTVYAYKQSAAEGTQVNMGEIITVSFKTTVDVAD